MKLRTMLRRRRPVPLPIAALAVSLDEALITTVPGKFIRRPVTVTSTQGGRHRIVLTDQQVENMDSATRDHLVFEARLREEVGHYGPEPIPAHLAAHVGAARSDVA